MSDLTITVSEEDRQVIVLALAKLAVSRPGWRDACLRRIAVDSFHAGEMFDEFEAMGPDKPPNVRTCGICNEPLGGVSHIYQGKSVHPNCDPDGASTPRSC